MSGDGDINHAAFSYYSKLERVSRFVREQISEAITLAQAAEVAGLEKKYFSTFFRKKTGVNFHDWLRGLQVRRAKRMLQARHRTITEVAMSTGFEDLRTFERAFKKHTGMTPRAYRRRVRPA